MIKVCDRVSIKKLVGTVEEKSSMGGFRYCSILLDEQFRKRNGEYIHAPEEMVTKLKRK